MKFLRCGLQHSIQYNVAGFLTKEAIEKEQQARNLKAKIGDSPDICMEFVLYDFVNFFSTVLFTRGNSIFLLLFFINFLHAGRTMQLTKMVMRKDAVEALENRREEDIKEFVDSIMDEEVQKAIGLQVEKLRKKK